MYICNVPCCKRLPLDFNVLLHIQNRNVLLSATTTVVIATLLTVLYLVIEPTHQACDTNDKGTVTHQELPRTVTQRPELCHLVQTNQSHGQ